MFTFCIRIISSLLNYTHILTEIFQFCIFVINLKLLVCKEEMFMKNIYREIFFYYIVIHNVNKNNHLYYFNGTMDNIALKNTFVINH